MASYRLTPARMRALKKAQLISARNRKGKGKLKRNAIIGATGVSLVALAGGAAYARHKISGSSLSMSDTRGATPMINIAGTSVPGTRSGLKFAEYGHRHGFAVRYTHRNKEGDKDLFRYRHLPITREAVSATFGKLTGRSKNLSRPQLRTTPWHMDADLVNEIKSSTHTPEGRAFARAARKESRGGALSRQRQWPEIEAQARMRKYKNAMAARGKDVSYEHFSYVSAKMRVIDHRGAAPNPVRTQHITVINRKFSVPGLHPRERPPKPTKN